MSIIQLRPTGISSGSPATTGDSPWWKCVDDPPGAPDDAATYIAVTSGSCFATIETMPSSYSVASVKLVSRVRELGGAGTSDFKMQIKIAGTPYDGTQYGMTVSQAWVTLTDTFLVDPGTLAPWTTDRIRLVTVGAVALTIGSDQPDVSQWYLEVDFVPAAAKVEPARDRSSRVLHVARKPTVFITTNSSLVAADAYPGDLLSVSHPEGISADGLGWGESDWQRRPSVILAQTINPNSFTVTTKGIDGHAYQFLTSFWRTWRTRDIPASQVQGIAKLGPGEVEVFSRSSKAWVYAPDGTVVPLTQDVQKIISDGHRFDPTRTNGITNSSFTDGNPPTGWTFDGASYNINGNTIALATDVLLFAASEGTNALKFTSGSIPGQQRAYSSYSANYSANQVVAVSFDYRTSATIAGLGWQLQRNVDSFWWNEGSRLWQAGEVVNGIASSAGVNARILVAAFSVGTNATGVRFMLQMTPVVSGQVCWLFHSQTEAGNWHTPHIVSRSSGAQTRDRDFFYAYTDAYPHVWPFERGTLFARVVNDWNESEAGATQRLIFQAYQGGSDPAAIATARSNYDALWAESGNLVHSVARDNGVTTTNVKAVAWTREQVHVVAFRWTSRRGDLGLSALTRSTFVDGVKGTDVVPADVPIRGSRTYLSIGSNALGGNQFGGRISDVRIVPVALPDEVVADVSAAMLVTV